MSVVLVLALVAVVTVYLLRGRGSPPRTARLRGLTYAEVERCRRQLESTSDVLDLLEHERKR